MDDGTGRLRPAIARYRIESGRAIRLPPLALSFGGFIDEWLSMDDADASRWCSRDAAKQHHDLWARYQKGSFTWEHVATCPGTDPAREIAIRWNDSGRNTVFRLSASTAAKMRLLSVSGAYSQSYREVDIRTNDKSIMAEPSR